MLGSFLDAGAIDEVHVFIAPRLLGGREAKSPIGGRGAASIAEALALSEWNLAQIETDVMLATQQLSQLGHCEPVTGVHANSHRALRQDFVEVGLQFLS